MNLERLNKIFTETLIYHSHESLLDVAKKPIIKQYSFSSYCVIIA